MATIDQAVAPPIGDVALVRRVAAGDELAAAQLMDRHRAAVADCDESPDPEAVELSGQWALAQVRSGSGSALPFRARWLSLHTQGALPDDEELGQPVWDAFCALSPAEQTALWHREVEGQGDTEIAALLGTDTAEIRRHLLSAYAAVRARIEAAAPASRTPAMASQLLLLQHSLRDVLAGVVLGPAAARYLAVRPRAGRRVVIDATPPRHHHSSGRYLSGLTAAAVAVAAVVVLGPGEPGTTSLPSAGAAPLEPPVPGVLLQAEEPAVVRTPARERTSRAVATTSSAVTTTAVATSGDRGPAAPTGGPGPNSTASPPTGGSPPPSTPQPDPAPVDDGPGQGLDHANENGVKNGVRSHGAKSNKGGAKPKGNSPGKSHGKP